MRIAVTGATGQLGCDVVQELTARGHQVTALGSADMDITDSKAVLEKMRELNPEAVIHCAAWTAVDDAEEEKNRERVFAVNAVGTENMAMACHEVGSKLLYISTDYVFSGKGEKPWKPECTDFKPVNVYGESKLRGEEAVRRILTQWFIVRISWVFGVHGKNFVRTMLRVGSSHDTVRVVNDQIGTPTYTADLARLLADMIVTEEYGVYHATNEGGYVSWADFSEEIFRRAGMNVTVIPVTTEEYGLSKANRPFNSRMDKQCLVQHGFEPLPDWRDALSRFFDQLRQE